MLAWASEVNDTNSATAPMSTCSLLISQRSLISVRSSTMRSQTIDEPLPVHYPAVLFSFLDLMPSPRQSFNGCGEPTIQSGKPLVDHMVISHSSDDASCRYPKLPSTHTTRGQLPTGFDNARIINDDSLRCHPPGLRSIIRSLQDPTTAEYIRVPLAPGTTHINILLSNLRQSTIHPSSISFEDAIVSWYSDLLLHGRSAADTTSIKNGIVQAFEVNSPTHSNLHNFTSILYIHVLSSMFAHVLCFYTFSPPFHKADPTMAFAE